MSTAPDVRERPIPFSPSMMQALQRLENPKSQTRRIVKKQPSVDPLSHDYAVHAAVGHADDLPGKPFGVSFLGDRGMSEHVRCPYGKPGDLLWVREAWSTAIGLDKFNATEIAAQALDANYPKPWAPLRYAVDGATRDAGWSTFETFGGAWGRPRLARFMPRWASRITLEITEVRVQRLQDITEEDAKAEGVTPLPLGKPDTWSHVNAYVHLWESINGKRAPWASSPYVWCISFRRLATKGEEAATA